MSEAEHEVVVISDHVSAIALRTPTLPPATHTNTYVVGRRSLLVFEPASPDDDEIDRLGEELTRRMREGATLVAIVLTHHHVDHIGGVKALAARFSLPVWAHRETASRLAWPVERLIDDGEQLVLDGELTLTAHHTPGHAPGHLAFEVQPDRLLIAGDMVAGVGTILVEPSEGHMGQYLASLERLARLPVDRVLPAHGPVLGPEVFPRYIAHRRMREAKIVAAIEEAGNDLEGLLVRAYDDVAPRALPLARLSLAAHVEELAREGRVSIIDGIVRRIDAPAR